ncbi:MerR family transcriptional regulator [Peribacillus deserti]|uniref:MerR family DNA-binding transcriptional regulator n=1 Tax=Peribacillus deserti TaxID=673318 RepID=A0A2N5M3Y5_9BACI|nr:MerR family transcriptional regulator [Peribacillus deserti]PLT29068.1 MerR family DNA-binding transcriptional regulator [Peribacillus deserti]
MTLDPSYKTKKVITIGIVSELTGLSVRQIRYYEERKLIFPERTERGSRKFSFDDVERLMDIAAKREEGVQTHEIRQDYMRELRKEEYKKIRQKMLQGQINAQFGVSKNR